MDLLSRVFDTVTRPLLLPTDRGPVAPVRHENVALWASHVRAQSARTRPGTWSMSVVRRVQETRDVCSLWLKPENGAGPACQAGQFFTCQITHSAADQPFPKVARAYSLSNVPDDEGLVRLTVKRLDGGDFSEFIHQHLQPGDQLSLSGPSGDFVLPEQAPKRIIMVAGGVGVTPLRSLIESALVNAPSTAIQLLYQARNLSHLVFRKELDALAARYPTFQWAPVLSKPAASWKGHKGRITAQWLSQNAALDSDCHVYVCGPDALNETAKQWAQQSKLPSSQFHQEVFLPAAAHNQALPDTPQSVRFAASQLSTQAQPGQSLLEAGLAAGVDMGYSCQVGGCGHCRVKLLEGETVSDSPNCLSDAEYQQGYRLACLTYACGPVAVDI